MALPHSSSPSLSPHLVTSCQAAASDWEKARWVALASLNCAMAISRSPCGDPPREVRSLVPERRRTVPAFSMVDRLPDLVTDDSLRDEGARRLSHKNMA